ncbi:PAS domain-containing protein [candidate division WWE3 bacterium]|uniref:histidine kinase n=1 Tax=candidate division WWE3 bacterium TaxID=2053526 RepID=A0A955LL28_UNCKA|nr:PAS domain-containing protein [candidate division WWE3 bacterium]
MNIKRLLLPLVFWIIAIVVAALLSLNILPINNDLRTMIMAGIVIFGALFHIITLFLAQKAKSAPQMSISNSVFDAIEEGIVIVNADGIVSVTNPAALSILKLTHEEIINQDYRKVIPFFNESGDSLYIGTGNDPYQEVLKTNQSQQLKNLQLYKGEETVYINASFSPFIGANGKVTGVFTLLQDITEEQALEKMKLDFVAMAAHELRTPMTSIRGYLEILINETQDTAKPEHIKLLQHAMLSADRLVNLMNNLLSVSQIERHKLQPNLTPTDIVDLLKTSIQNFKPEAEEKGLMIELVEQKTSTPQVLVDKKLIPQIVDNLIANAISYTTKGSVVVGAAYQPGSKTVVVSVKDTGQGIPVEALPHMFQKFYRVSSLLEQGSKGTGLGLYIAKKLIELHNGRIWVESAEGKGTTFYFSLPIAE